MTAAVQEDDGDRARLTTKGKRTKRQRPASPITAAAASTSSISNGSRGGDGESPELIIQGKEDNNKKHEAATVNKSVTSTDDEVNRGWKTQGTTEEEEDMANCLILLKKSRKTGFLNDKKPLNPLGLGLELGLGYQCKTCDKGFPSFQALGGHRASHKKPKNARNNHEIISVFREKKSPDDDEKHESGNRVKNSNCSFLSLQVTSSSSLSLYVNAKKQARTHGCSICKAEFSSGQALGGHMRRHRNANATTAAAATSDNVGNSYESTSSDRHHQSCQESNSKRLRNLIPELDLNLPAPEDNRNEKPRFPTSSNKDHDQILVFTAASAASS